MEKSTDARSTLSRSDPERLEAKSNPSLPRCVQSEMLASSHWSKPMPALEALYEAHLKILRSRMDAALAACGFDAAAIHSGRLWMQFLDDQPYPFKVNPHFKTWVPLVD